jgi:hypothetical protein
LPIWLDGTGVGGGARRGEGRKQHDILDVVHDCKVSRFGRRALKEWKSERANV